MPDHPLVNSGPVRLVLSTFLCLIVILLALPGRAVAYEQQIADEAQAIANQLAGSETKTLAVVDFTDLQGNVTELGRFLAEELSIRLAGLSQGFDVVDRTHLRALLKEHKLSSTGLIDPATARELGRIAGVDALITGTVTPLGDTVRCAVKVLNTETARIVTSTTANIPRTQAIETLLKREIVHGTQDSAQSPRPGVLDSGRSTEELGFRFRLKDCTQTGGTLVCSLTVTDEGEDCDLRVTGQSRAIDSQGNQYSTARIQLGNRVTGYSISDTHEMLVQGIPTGLILTFDEVTEGVSRLALLEIVAVASRECNASGRGDRQFRAQIRNVPVSPQ